jgi:HAD superfamily hydrolase (TIGR01509 family)
VLHVSALRGGEAPKSQDEKGRSCPENHDGHDGGDQDRPQEVWLHRSGTLLMTFPPRNIEAVIFDFDETMIDLERQHTAAHARLCAAMGSRYDDMPEEFRRGSGRRVIDDVREMREFFGWTGDVDDLFDERQRYFDEEIALASDLKLMRGVERIIRELHARGYRMAITTSAVRNSVETILRRFHLRDFFSIIVDGTEVKQGKPDPEAYLMTASWLSVAPEQCLVFEDSAVGVLAAKLAGMICIAVRNPRAFVYQDLSPADRVVDSFDDIASLRD